MLLCANLVGIYFRYLTQASHKQTFQDTRNCIESRVKLEHERQQQVSSSRLHLLICPVSKTVLWYEADILKCTSHMLRRVRKFCLEFWDSVIEERNLLIYSAVCHWETMAKNLNDVWCIIHELEPIVMLHLCKNNSQKMQNISCHLDLMFSLAGTVITQCFACTFGFWAEEQDVR